jgi:hypothetical protein
MWYRCITSHLTFRARHAAHALAARRLTGLGLPLLSSPADAVVLFFEPESVEAGDCGSSVSRSIDAISFIKMAGMSSRFQALSM